MAHEHTGSAGPVTISSGSVVIQGTTHDGTTSSLIADIGHLVTVDALAHLTNQSRGWVASYVWETLAAAANADILVVSGPTNRKFSFFEGAATGTSRLRLYEIPNAYGGTSVDLVSLNRLTVGVATTTITHTPTVVSVGRLLWQGIIPAASFATLGGAEQISPRWMLGPSARYLIRLTNLTAGTIAASIGLTMYQAEA